jgi:hypothetical protein
MTNTTTGLTDADVEFGKRLWHELDASRQFPVRGMLWLLESEWRLVIASEIVDKMGPRDAYRKLAEIVPPDPVDSAQLLKVELISPKNPLYEALRAMFAHTPPSRIEGARLASSQVGGRYIEDAYFYGVR